MNREQEIALRWRSQPEAFLGLTRGEMMSFGPHREIDWLIRVAQAARNELGERFVDVWSMPERDLTICEQELRTLLSETPQKEES